MDKIANQVKLKNEEIWRGKGYSFFINTKCEAFPCHPTDNTEDFNCLFCYCPLYTLGDKCGGNFKYMPNGVKDCSGCTIPHRRDNYGMITERFDEIVEMMKNSAANHSK
ncbi:MAG: cysteine-rich small domain-containing protein [Peptococcaceae bacterium]